jgi:hypothetical protein
MAAGKYVLSVNMASAGDIALSSSKGVRDNTLSVINHLEGLNNGSKSASTVSLLASAVSASVSIDLTSVAAGTVLLINGVPFTALSGTATAGNNEFDISGSDTADAAALAAAINASTTAGIYEVLSATSDSDDVTITAKVPGLVGNAITVENLGVVATGTITCASVDNNDTVTINGVTLTAKTTVSDATVEWLVTGTDTVCAAALAALINTTATSALITGQVRALSRAGVVHLFAKYGGTAGNAITLASSDGTDLAVAVTNGRLAGGTVTQHEGVQASGTITCTSVANAETVTVNGVIITAHTNTQANNQFSIAGTDDEDAAALCLAINNSTTAALKDVVATVATNVVTVTSRRGGPQGNAITMASGAGTMVCSVARLASGAVPTVAVISGGGLGTQTGGGFRLGSGSETTIDYTR